MVAPRFIAPEALSQTASARIQSKVNAAVTYGGFKAEVDRHPVKHTDFPPVINRRMRHVTQAQLWRHKLSLTQLTLLIRRQKERKKALSWPSTAEYRMMKLKKKRKKAHVCK